MGFRIKSLSQDNIDVYTHTWSVVFLLLLAFVMLLMPMRPSPRSEPLAVGKTSCWCPAQFEQSQVDYTNSICSAQFKAELPVYLPFMPFRPRPKPVNNLTPQPKEEETAVHYGRDALKLKTPVILFVLAICLMLPHILWCILTNCTHCVNLDQTLESFRRGESMDSNARRQMNAGLMQAFLGRVRTNEKSSTCRFMLTKVFMAVAVIAEIIVITYHILPVFQESETGSLATGDLSDKRANFTIFTCYFTIKQRSVAHDYTVMCTMERHEPTQPPLEVTDTMVCNVFMSVLSVLITLAVVNVVNTFAWLSNLCSQSVPKQMGLDKKVPLDLILLVLMARSNLSVGVAQALVEGASADESQCDDGKDRATAEIADDDNC